MHLLKLKTASAVAALSIGFIGGGLITAHAKSEIRRAEHAPAVLSMPLGAVVAADADSAAVALAVIPRLSPTPDAELNELKNLMGAGNGPDSVAEAVAPSAPLPALSVLNSCAMNVGAGSAPSDVHGAAGPTNIIEVTNRHIMVRSKACGLVSSMTLAAFFGGAGGFAIPGTQSLFDPRVVYDRINGRCIVTVESRDSGNTDQFLYVASSRTSSCTTWRRIRFALSQGASLFCKAAAANFYDFPNVGYNASRLVITANNFSTSGGAFSYASLITIDKVALHGTATVFARCFRGGTLPSNMTPAVVASPGTGSMYILSPGSGSGSSIRRLRLVPQGSGSGISDNLVNTSSISIPSWTAPPDAPQPNLQKLDTSDGRFSSATKQIGSLIWAVHTINVGGRARWRLYRLSTTGTTSTFTFTPTTSTCANVDHNFNPSLDTNSATAGAAIFVTSTRTCPSQSEHVDL
jgi:hypothetical protein